LDVAAFRAGLKGRYFGELVLHHLRRQDFAQLVQGLNGTIALLPAVCQPRVESFIDRANVYAYDTKFWGMDCADAFTLISNLAKTHLADTGRALSEEDCFNMFQIAVLSYAYSAHDQPKMRSFIKASYPGFWKRLFRKGS
jgi:hypothetical protein